jgi:hypothetical protein
MERRTLQAAFDGSRMAIRTVLKWIHKREQARPAPQRNLPIFRSECATPASVDQALLILGIASEVNDQTEHNGEHFLQLQPWAVTSALTRLKRKPSARVIADTREPTRDAGSVPWPRVDGDE